jgi:retron-type reverse transcriptase
VKIYSKFLIDKNLPPIINISYLSEFSEVALDILSAAIVKPDKFYRQFTIPKRRGGNRLIEAPIPSLLICQRWISANLLEKVPLNDSATAYRKGVGLLENVKPHLSQKQLLKIDLKDFFHSITINRVVMVFRNMGYLHKTSYELAALCCLRGRLPQGAATSPTLSNIIAKRMDRRLSALAKKYELNYTRYSDDLTFSGDLIPAKLLSLIEFIIKDEGFAVNAEKTRLYTRPGKRIVTGISVSGSRPKLPRNSKREIRQDLYNLLRQGSLKDVLQQGGREVFFIESLKGRLCFWLTIEPEAQYPRLGLERLERFSQF